MPSPLSVLLSLLCYLPAVEFATTIVCVACMPSLPYFPVIYAVMQYHKCYYLYIVHMPHTTYLPCVLSLPPAPLPSRVTCYRARSPLDPAAAVRQLTFACAHTHTFHTPFLIAMTVACLSLPCFPPQVISGGISCHSPVPTILNISSSFHSSPSLSLLIWGGGWFGMGMGSSDMPCYHVFLPLAF